MNKKLNIVALTLILISFMVWKILNVSYAQIPLLFGIFVLMINLIYPIIKDLRILESFPPEGDEWS